MKIDCCKELKQAIADDAIRVAEYEVPPEVYILGKPSLFDDGDGHFDEIDNDIRIFFCPFCGKKFS